MALKIRLSRGGAKKRPFYKIVVAEALSPRDGKFIERLGSYNPMVAKDHAERLVLDVERAKYWISKGAQPTLRVAKMLSSDGLVKAPVIREQPIKSAPGKKRLEREAEAAEKLASAAEAPAEEAPAAEAPAEEAPAAEAPAEEAPAAEAPAEEAPAAEAPAEEAPAAEAPAEEAPAAEAPAEEAPAAEAPAEEAPAAEKRIKNNRYTLSNSNLIEIGCFVGVHGIKGEVKVKSYAEKPENIFTYEEIFIDNDINPIKLKLVRKVKQNLICKIENIKTRNDAENFRNSKLFIKRESLPKLSDDEFYHRDLVSFEVYNTKRESFGFIVSLNDFGGGLLLEVNKDNKMFYLPASKRFLNEIKYKEKEVILNLDLSFLNG